MPPLTSSLPAMMIDSIDTVATDEVYNSIYESSFDLGLCDPGVLDDDDDDDDDDDEVDHRDFDDDRYNDTNTKELADRQSADIMPMMLFSQFLPPLKPSAWAFAFQATTASSLQEAKKKAVSFHLDATVYHPVLHISDYTPDEKQACWVTRSEKIQSRTSIRATIKLSMATGQYPSNDDDDDSGDDCMRGLESRTTQGTRQKADNKFYARMAVFSEQHDQLVTGKQGGPGAIAQAYAKQTKHCQVLAHMIGLRDEQEARVQDAATRLQNAAKILEEIGFYDIEDEGDDDGDDEDDDIVPSLGDKGQGFSGVLVQFSSKAA